MRTARSGVVYRKRYISVLGSFIVAHRPTSFQFPPDEVSPSHALYSAPISAQAWYIEYNFVLSQ